MDFETIERLLSFWQYQDALSQPPEVVLYEDNRKTKIDKVWKYISDRNSHTNPYRLYEEFKKEL